MTSPVSDGLVEEPGEFDPARAVSVVALGRAERELLAVRIRLGEKVCAPRMTWRGRKLAVVPDLNVVIATWMKFDDSPARIFKWWGFDGDAEITRFTASGMRTREMELLKYLEDGVFP